MLEWLFLGMVIFFILLFVFIYNNLISLRARIDNAWAQIDVQLKKRYDLVPNLVETVKGYAKHEKEIFENVTKARTAALSATSVKEKAKADSEFSAALKSIFAIAENYPQLRASENFKLLQEQLDGIESKIAYARQFYNDAVLEYNTKIAQIPYSIIASLFAFTPRDYFNIEEKERQNIKVSFT
ncbi:MAG: LemA family protein [Candidatus Omnitrophica bacterium]|nr:LemA family protein [Candidatus Omnitrophota bacterium]